MKKILLITTAILTLNHSSIQAQESTLASSKFTNNPVYIQKINTMEQDIAILQKEWARIKYQITDKKNKLDKIHKLEKKAALITAKYPNKAEPKIWEGIILATDAGIVKGLSALGKVKKAKALLESSLQQNPNALSGSAYTSLGSLYYQVPGWPIAFGDNEKAEQYLKRAIKINANGIDPNFFYGDFLFQEDRYKESQTYLNKALEAVERPKRPLADAGRRQEIRAILVQIDQKLNNKTSKQYN